MSEPIVKALIEGMATVDLGKLVEALLALAYSAQHCKDKAKALALKVEFVSQSMAEIDKSRHFDQERFRYGVFRLQEVYKDAIYLLQKYRNRSIFGKILKAPFSEDGFDSIHQRLDICIALFGFNMQVGTVSDVTALQQQNQRFASEIASFQQKLDDMARLQRGELNPRETEEANTVFLGLSLSLSTEDTFGGYMLCADLHECGASTTKEVLLITFSELGAQELAILKRLSESHANILQFLGKFVENKTVYAVMERPGREIRTLDMFISEHPQLKHGNWSLKKNFALEIALGMQFAHAAGIVHKNLRSPNIFVSDTEDELLHLKIFGFNCGRIKTEVSDKRFQSSEQFRWAAPEMLQRNRGEFSEQCDVFSLGVVLWELITWSSPFQEINRTLDVIKARTKQGVELDFSAFEGCPPALQSFIRISMDCMEKEGSRRPGTDKVVEELSLLVPENMEF